MKNKFDDNFIYFLKSGKLFDAYNYLGCHVVNGHTFFAVYAPNCEHVYLVTDYNNYNETELELENINQGLFYLDVNSDLSGYSYKYLLVTYQGEKIYKSDPFALYSELRPKQNSIVYKYKDYKWNDEVWVNTHKKTYNEPVNIYELHFGSWKKKEDGSYYNYLELAEILIPYLKKHSYTHLEIMPIYEHPLDASWGYQGTGYYSVTSRYGTPEMLMEFIDKCHQNNIGVIFDWVPGHICKDAHGLYRFDGTFLFEYEREEDRENYNWGTANLDLGKGLTRSFLYSNALFYLKKFHVDGFRVDAVSNIIYYLGNKDRGVNTGACDFLRGLSRTLFAYDDRILLVAEDSSDFNGVTKPVDIGGLGFNYKWDMGWMNDTLKYFEKDPIYRKYHHHMLTFSMAYFYSEQFLLPFSHDEVVHLKKSILNKMPGDYWQKFANYRLLLGYMLTHPGKKLNFMGNELATYDEWAYAKELGWYFLDYESHKKANIYVKDLNKLYLKEKALYELDYDYNGFRWIDADNCDQSIYIYTRYAKNKRNHLIVILNCTPNTYHDYQIGVPSKSDYKEIFNSDNEKYFGSNQVNKEILKNLKEEKHNLDNSIKLTVPPLGIVILKPFSPRKK